MIISDGNSIVFQNKNENVLSTFDNRTFGELVHRPKVGYIPIVYLEQFRNITIQCIVSSGNDIEIVNNINYQLGSKTLVKTINVGSIYDIYDVQIVISNGSNFVIEITELNTNDTWVSGCLATLSVDELVNNGYVNVKYRSENVNKLIDYSNDLVSEFWIKTDMFQYQPDSEIISSDNNIKLNETLKRNILFKAGNIVSQQVEQMKIAMSSTELYINDIRFTQIEEVETSYINNYADIEVSLTQYGLYLNQSKFKPREPGGVDYMQIEGDFIVS